MCNWLRFHQRCISHRPGDRTQFYSHFRGRNNQGVSRRFTQDFEGQCRDFDKHCDGRCDNSGQLGYSECECPLKSIDEQNMPTRIQATWFLFIYISCYLNVNHDSEEELDRNTITRIETTSINKHINKSNHDSHSSPPPCIGTTTTKALFSEMITQQDMNNQVLTTKNHSTTWYLDLGASNHFTCERSHSCWHETCRTK